MRILIDLDSTIADNLTPWLAWHNAKDHGETLYVSDILSLDMHYHTKTGRDIYDVLEIPGFFAGFLPYPGAVEAVKALNENHEVYIVGAAHSPGPAASEKLEWIKKWLPFLRKEQVVITHSKHIIEADVLIDDAPHNARAYRKAFPEALIYGFAFPYNKDCTAFNFRFSRPESDGWKRLHSWIDYQG